MNQFTMLIWVNLPWLYGSFYRQPWLYVWMYCGFMVNILWLWGESTIAVLVNPPSFYVSIHFGLLTISPLVEAECSDWLNCVLDRGHGHSRPIWSRGCVQSKDAVQRGDILWSAATTSSQDPTSHSLRDSVLLKLHVRLFLCVTFSLLYGSSAVECRTLNRESPGSIPPFATVSKFGHFRSLRNDPSSLSCIKEYLAIEVDSGGNVSD